VPAIVVIIPEVIQTFLILDDPSTKYTSPSKSEEITPGEQNVLFMEGPLSPVFEQMPFPAMVVIFKVTGEYFRIRGYHGSEK
jgi:hypothetical protein